MARQRASQMDSGVARLNLKKVPQLTLKCVYQRGPTLGVNRTHPPNMSSEMTFADEVGQHGLINGGRTPADDPPGSDKCFHQVRRDHHVTNPHGREQHFSESAKIDDPPSPIQTL